MIVLLDNYDSFTWNLVQYLAELGAELSVHRNDELSVDQILSMNPNAIVLSPGPGRPENAGMMNALIEKAPDALPILGVCLGHQGIGQVLGSKITYAPSLMHGKTSEVHHDKSALYAGIPSPFTATRYHSLVLERESLPKDLTVTAWTSDGVIMGIQHTTRPMYGVQYHPESILTTEGKAILKNFLSVLR
ncbi:MAG: aminodeoxychorismate/anthranilate synthase component II [Candidatus Zixiibacteriota bacterium]